MLFEDLIKKTETYILNEKYFRYDIPKGKPELLYDFYVLTYLNYLVDLPSKNFRDLNTDIEDSVKDAYNKLLPELRTELLDALFYSICAEMRHKIGRAHV